MNAIAEAIGRAIGALSGPPTGSILLEADNRLRIEQVQQNLQRLVDGIEEDRRHRDAWEAKQERREARDREDGQTLLRRNRRLLIASKMAQGLLAVGKGGLDPAELARKANVLADAMIASHETAE